MGPEVPGVLAIWLALVFNSLAGVAFVMAARGNNNIVALAHRSYHIFVAFSAVATAYLFYLFFSYNFAIKYVYEYNELSQPFLYVLSGFWGGWEGSYLLWLFLSAIFGYIVLNRGGRYRNAGMAMFCLINLFFLAIMAKLSPFTLLDFPVADGLGLNPLLRDPWMAIHPPVIFAGYAIAAVPFVYAIAAMFKNDYTDWVKRTFPWVGFSALMLGAGNILGGYWAYKTLGWGGFWAWDPVENSSFVPWMISLALLHGLIIERRSGALRKSNLLLSAFLFLLVVYGTFLTRSGVLADFSVHSFTDMGINSFLISFMAVFFTMTIAVFAWRAKGIESAKLDYGPFGRDFSLLTAMILLFAFGTIVILWSSLPVITGWFSDEPRAADIATYNQFAIPLAIIMAFLVTISPFTGYQNFKLDAGPRKAAIIFGAAAVVSFGLFFFALSAGLAFTLLFTLVAGGTIFYMQRSDFRKGLIPALAAFLVTIGLSIAFGATSYLFVLFFATAAMALVGNLISLGSYLPGRWRLMGGQVTHFGFGIMLIGILGSSGHSTNEVLTVPQGETATSEMFGVTLGYQGLANDFRQANNELLVTLDMGDGPKKANPQFYYSERMDAVMKRPYIERTLLYDLYLAPQQIQRGDGGQGLALKKGESKLVGDIEFSFAEFEVGGHGGDEGMEVLARLDVTHEGTTTTIKPAVRHTTDQYGDQSVQSAPAELSLGGHTYLVTLEQVQADDGLIVISAPGLIGSASPEQLIIDISKKPAISLVWLGTTFLLLGTVIVVIRRRSELEYSLTSDQPEC